MSPLFCDVALAERIERAEADLMARAGAATPASFALPAAGGVASFAGPDSPFTKVAGVGFGGMPDFDAIERAFASRGMPVQVELPHLAEPAIGAALTGRGYRLVSFENVLGLALGDEAEHVPPSGIEVRPSDDDFDEWIAVVTDAFAAADTEGVPSHEDFPREALAAAMRAFEAAGVRRYTAVRDGELAGGASFHVADGIAQLTGAATAPAHRRHGVQTALLMARLAEAAEAGCDIAVVTTQPGSKSQQNVQRQGFSLLYTRAILVKDA